MKGDTGKIRYPFRASQQIDFSGVRFGNATPSNVDGLLELDDEFFVLLEYKHQSAAPMSCGQRVLIERVTDQLASNGKFSCAIIAIHDHPSSNDIDGANAQAIEIRWDGKWHNISNQNRTVASWVTGFYDYAFRNPLQKQ